MNRRLDALWPIITDQASAKRAADYGLAVLIFGALITAFFGSSPWRFVDVFILLTCAWGVKKLSRVAACVAFAFHVATIVDGVFISGIESSGLPLRVFLAFLLVSAIRGTFAYHRFSKAAAK